MLVAWDNRRMIVYPREKCEEGTLERWGRGTCLDPMSLLRFENLNAPSSPMRVSLVCKPQKGETMRVARVVVIYTPIMSRTLSTFL